MKRQQIILKEAFCVFISTSVAVLPLWLITTQAKLLFSVILFLLMYSLTRCYYNKHILHIRPRILSALHRSSWLILPLFTLFSLFIIESITPVEASYVNWWEIPLANYLRAVAAFLIVSFIPGYFILGFFEAANNLGALERLIFAYIISIFINSLIIYFFQAWCKIFLPSIVLILTIFLTVIYILKHMRLHLKFCIRKRNNIDSYLFPPHFQNPTVLLFTIIFICVGSIHIFSSNFSLIHDLRPLHGWGVMVTRNVIHSYFNPLVMYLALIFSLSGLPVLNVHILLNLSNVIFLLAFLLMVNAFFKNRCLSVIATVLLVLCGGFGGLIVAHNYATTNIIDERFRQNILNILNIETLLDMRYAYYTPFLFFSCMWWGLASTFVSIYLLKKDDNSFLAYFLITISVAFAYLAHRVEITIFFIAMLIMVLFHSETDFRKRIKKCTLSGIFGLFVGVIIIYLTPGGFVYGIYDLWFIFGLIFLALVSLLVSLTSFSLNIKFSIKRRHKTLLYFLALYLTALSIIVWREMRQEIARNFDIIYQRGIIPWFFYPLLLGPLGMFALFSICYFIREKECDKDGNERIEQTKIFLLIIISLIILGRMLTSLNSYLDTPLPFWETRTIYWVKIFTAIFSADFIMKFSTRASNIYRRQLITSGIIALLFFGGLPSTLVRIDYWERYAKFGLAGEGETVVSTKELEAIDYLRLNDSPYGQVLTLTDQSWIRLKYYAGIPNVFHRPILFFGSTQPEFVLHTVSTQEFIYLTSRDYDILQSKYVNSFLKQHIMPYLPVVFNNSENVVYKIPELFPPSDKSELALVVPNIVVFIDDELTSWRMRAQSGTMKNISIIHENGILTISGILNSTVRDYYLLDKYLGEVNTSDYPYLAVRWRSTDYCAMLEVRYTDGTYLTAYAASQVTSKFLPEWSVTVIKQPPDKTVEYIIIGVDDRAKIDVEGFNVVQFDYIMLCGQPKSEYAFPLVLIAASGFNYTTVSERDPNLLNYKTLIIPHDLMTYDFYDNFTNDLRLWNAASGQWLIKDGELHQIQTQPYVDAVIYAGDSAWSNYMIETKVKAVGDFVDDVCLLFRFQDPKNTYDFRIQGGLIRIGKRVAGSWVELARKTDYEIKGDTWYKLKVFVNGSNIISFIDDALIFNITDDTFKQGKIALMTEGIHAAFDYINVVSFERLKMLSEYLDWIKSGSQLVILSNSNLGFFASLLDIKFNGETVADNIKSEDFSIQMPLTKVPILSSKSSDVTSKAKFFREDTSVSVFAFQKDIGSGKLVYINFQPVFHVLNNVPNDQRWNLLKQIGSIIKRLLNQNVSISSNNQWNYEVAECVKLRGLIEITSEYLPIPITSIDANCVDFSLSGCYINHTFEFKPHIYNVTIQTLKIHGSVCLKLVTTYVELSPLSCGPYISLELPEEFDLILELNDNASITMEMIVDELSRYNITTQGGIIRIKSKPHAILFVRSPTMQVYGKTLFEKAYIGWIGSPHSVRSEGYSFKIEGNTLFKVKFADNNIALISHLKYNGTATVYSPLIPRWNEWNIQWYKVLTSPYHFLLLGVIAIFVLKKRIFKMKSSFSTLKF